MSTGYLLAVNVEIKCANRAIFLILERGEKIGFTYHKFSSIETKYDYSQALTIEEAQEFIIRGVPGDEDLKWIFIRIKDTFFMLHFMNYDNNMGVCSR